MLSSLCLVSCYAFSCQNKYFFGCGKTFCLHYRHLTPEARNYRPVNNILDILSKFPEQTASENNDNYHLRQPHCCLTPPPRGVPANIHIYVIFLETRIFDPHFAANSIGLSSFKFFWWFRKTYLFCKCMYQPFKVIQGH